MRIGELLNNPCFPFNADFRIVKRSENESVLMYDSTLSPDLPFDLMGNHISAINNGSDGIVEIEYK